MDIHDARCLLLAEIYALKGMVDSDDLPHVGLNSDWDDITGVLGTLRYRNDPAMYDRIWQAYISLLKQN